MKFLNRNNLDLQKIASLMNDNNIEYSFHEGKIIINSNSVEVHIKPEYNKLDFSVGVPFFVYGLTWLIGSIIFFVVAILIFSNIEGFEITWEFRGFLGAAFVIFMPIFKAIASFYIYHIYIQIRPKVKTEENRILELLSLPTLTFSQYGNNAIKKYNDKDYQGAIEELELALFLKPTNPKVHFDLARIYSLIQNKDKSFYHLSYAARYNYKNIKLRTETSANLEFLRQQIEYKDFVNNGFKLTKINYANNTNI